MGNQRLPKVRRVRGSHPPALCAAASWGRLKVVTPLLDRGVDVNLPDGIYGTALGAAVIGGSRVVVTLLLERGADVNLTGGHYGTALGAASYMGRQTSAGSGCFCVGRRPGHCHTSPGLRCGRQSHGGHFDSALGAAAYCGDWIIVTLLLDRGADANLTSDSFGTALGAAAYAGELAVATLLLDRGANPNLANPATLQKRKGIMVSWTCWIQSV
ncbi:ankyrin repeat-containing domain protein [Tirmania nivea]|nr:ankyrin repeat-containing domain protein [Tirmania nivea]